MCIISSLIYLYITNFSYAVGWSIGGLDRDPRRGSGLYHLVDSRIVLIRLAVLGHFMMRAKHWAHAGTGPIE